MSRQKQLKTILVDKKLRESTNLGVEITNSKRQVKRKLSHVVQVRVCRVTSTWCLTSSMCPACATGDPLGPFMSRQPVPVRRITLPTKSTLKGVYMRKTLTPLPEPISLARTLIASNSTRACSDCLTLAELTRLGEVKCLHGEKMARLGASCRANFLFLF